MVKTWAVIGGGNGGQAIAGHLASMGEKVRLFDVVPATVEALNEKREIQLHHAVEACGELEFATCDMEEALNGANHIMVVLPSIYHESIAKQIVPHLKDGMVVFLHPEASCGAIAFRKIMKDMGCEADVVVGAACTLLYSARIQSHGDIFIYGIKDEVPIAALPASDNDKLEEAICQKLPWFHVVKNVLMTSLDNLNAMVHPLPMLLNTSRIEAEPFVPFQYYHEGFTPSIGKYVEEMDKERIAIANALDLEQRSICDEYISMYHCGDETTPLYQLCKNNKGYEGIMCGNTLFTRYILEDIPYSLVAIRALGEAAGVCTPKIDAVITLGRAIMGDVMDIGRTSEYLGINNMTREELLDYITG